MIQSEQQANTTNVLPKPPNKWTTWCIHLSNGGYILAPDCYFSEENVYFWYVSGAIEERSIPTDPLTFFQIRKKKRIDVISKPVGVGNGIIPLPFNIHDDKER
ncbi:MAG: hypothetical protein ACRCVY_07760 [Commensalibacter sp.]